MRLSTTSLLSKESTQSHLAEVWQQAPVTTASGGVTALAVAVGVRSCVGSQLESKADVIRAKLERIQLCQDPLAEFAFIRESLGVSRVPHILRERGHQILEEAVAPRAFDDVGRLFPGFTQDNTEQASPSSQELDARGLPTLRASRTWEHEWQRNCGYEH